MNKLILEITSKAYNDIEIIADYISQDNQKAAIKMIKTFEKIFSALCEHPNLGKTRQDFTHLNVKFYVLKKHYIVVYRTIDEKTLRILRVLSTYQDICSKL